MVWLYLKTGPGVKGKIHIIPVYSLSEQRSEAASANNFKQTLVLQIGQTEHTYDKGCNLSFYS